MMAAPTHYKCTLLVQRISKDAETPDKTYIVATITAAEQAAEAHTFYAVGSMISGFTFNLPGNITTGTTVEADVEFMGDPIHQNYQLHHIRVVS